tara:strand:- start:176 stop:283 length:108 start_codon:yes stop_codon:yes gene_type:complete
LEAYGEASVMFAYIDFLIMATLLKIGLSALHAKKK